MKPSINSYYDKYWDREDTSKWTPEIRAWDKKEFQRKLGQFAGRQRVLDVGCGDATTYHKQLLGIVRELYGLDVSEKAVEQAKTLGIKAAVAKLDSEPFPFDTAYFEGATCIQVFEHLFDPLFTAREIHRVLKPGARLVTSVPNFGYFADRLEVLLRARVRNSCVDPKNRFAGAHIRFFSLREFKRMVREAGFKIVKVIPHSSCSIFDALWVIGRLVELSCWLKRKVPYVLRLGFLERIWPSVFAQHIMLVVEKPSGI